MQSFFFRIGNSFAAVLMFRFEMQGWAVANGFRGKVAST